ncbi:shikimate dehydrogenase [Microbacterium kribbense]|uniref:Shikimate dehydrogenase n=1 Tax=Microbacterium kribbense TaxID=433645 RepID=A0ABP7G5Z9_9MICO
MTNHGRYMVGLIGEGIGPSLSPALHTQEARSLGIDYEYRLFDLAQLHRPPESVGEILHELSDNGYCAVNITYPCKQLVLQHLDEIDENARRLGAVNLVLIRDGRFTGFNTDWVGFRDGVVDGLPGRRLDHIVQFGGGGAGSAAAYAMLSLGTIRLTLADIDPRRMAELADRLRASYPDRQIEAISVQGAEPVMRQVDGAINATPLGMSNHPGTAFDVTRLRPDAWVADVVYFPIETQLLREARSTGHEVLDGGRMNVGQAVEGMRLITGIRPDAARMRAHFLELTAHADEPAPNDKETQ